MATGDELEDLAEWIAAEVNPERSGRRKRLLDRALERIEAVLPPN